MLPGPESMRCNEMLGRLTFFPLEHKTLKGDIIKIYKNMMSKDKMNNGSSFPRVGASITKWCGTVFRSNAVA